MSLDKFLAALIPSDAWLAVVAPEGEYWRHTWISAEQRASRSATQYLPEAVITAPKAYFACSGYQQAGTDWAGRTKANVGEIKSLWLDIDAGAEKIEKHGDAVYETQEQALDAVIAFSKQHFFIPTYVVNSGTGLHVYWAFEAPVSAKMWVETLAPRFAQLCVSVGLKVDTSRTCDSASVLRIPGSRAGDGQVAIMYEGKSYPVETLAEKLPKQLVGTVRNFERAASTLPRRPYSAALVLDKARSGQGCAQIQALLETRGDAVEPLRRAGLALVFHGSEDADKKEALLLSISDGRPSFSYDKMIAKAQETKASYSCESWAVLDAAPCAGCRFNGLAKNPCRFGYEANQSIWELAATQDTPRADVWAKLSKVDITEVVTPGFGEGEAEAEEAEVAVTRVVAVVAEPSAELSYEQWLDAHAKLKPFKLKSGAETKYIIGGTANDPAKYIAGQWRAGLDATEWNDLYPVELSSSPTAQKYGVTRVAQGSGGTVSTQVVCDSTVVPHSIVVTAPGSAGAGEASGQLLIDYYSPIGHGKLSVPTAKYSAGCRGDSLAVMMGNVGITMDSAGLKGFVMYMQTAAATIVGQKGNVEQALAMGWTGKDSFVLGASNYMPDGSVRAVSLPDSLKHFATLGTTAGDLAQWNDLLRGMYVTDSSADMPLQFALLAGFGAPIHSRGQDIGGVIHLFSAASAAGKTTAQKAIAAIYDAPKGPNNHPTMLIAAKTDTTKARVHKLGMLNSLALLNDEITEMSPAEVAAFIYTSTQGRANDRMASDANRLRDNDTNWGAYAITSSNKRLSDVYSSVMQDSEGMAKRVWEIEIPAIRVAGGLAKDAGVVEPLLSGAVYGVAGAAWIKWLVSNWASVAAQKVQMIERLVADAGLTRADRFFANMGASALVAGNCAGKLGLHPFSMPKLYAYIVDALASTSAATEATDKTIAAVKAFLAKNLHRVARIDHLGAFTLTLNPPVGGSVGVFDQRTQTLALSETALIAAAVFEHGSPAEMRRAMRNLGALRTVRIAADELIPLAQCVVIDIRGPSGKVLSIGKIEPAEGVILPA